MSLLEEAPDMPVEQKAKYVHITLEKANRLERLINEFFEITRYNIQQIVLEKPRRSNVWRSTFNFCSIGAISADKEISLFSPETSLSSPASISLK